MTTRLLPPEEWPRLVGTEAETIWPMLDSARTQVLVVEDAGAIIGCWVLMNVMHAECLWIAASHRGKSSVARRLWTGMQRLAEIWGVSTIATAAVTDDVRSLLQHVKATRIPGDHYSMRIH